MDGILELSGITKVFPGGVVANRDAHLTLLQGEIHGVVGENGAGKSTLMNIVCGLIAADSGVVRIRGRQVHITSPRVARQLGIGMVHQHFMLVPSFTAAENVVLGLEPTKGGIFVDRERVRKEVRELSERYGMELPLDQPVRRMPVALRQRVEIVKVLYRGAEIMILDEPTSLLTPLEIAELFRMCRGMRAEGKTIVFISHKLSQVLDLCDRVTVMSKGRTIACLEAKRTSEPELARLMVGRDRIIEVRRSQQGAAGQVAISAEDLWIYDNQGLPAIKGVSLQVRSGEVLGVAGVQGNGQTELVYGLAGVYPVEKGRIRLQGVDITRSSVGSRRDMGLRHIPEDRMGVGLCLSASVAENLVADRAEICRFLAPLGTIRRKQRDNYAKRLMRDFNVLAPGPGTKAADLSGGNLQKVVVARELAAHPKVLISANPTQGLDIGASQFIYDQLSRARGEGCAILLVSVDLDEILLLSDRIVVIFEGRLVGEFSPAAVNPEQLGLFMTGARAQD